MNIFRRALSLKPPRIAFALLAAATVMEWTLRYEGSRYSVPWPLAAILAVAGFALMMIGWWQFRQRDVLICPTAPTSRLITDGVYRVTRNPMYLGIVLMLFGIATWIGSPLYYVAAVLFFLLMDRLFCPYEESKLNATFGTAYVDYLLRTRRWL